MKGMGVVRVMGLLLAWLLSACGGTSSDSGSQATTSGLLGDGSGENSFSNSSEVDASDMQVGDSISFRFDPSSVHAELSFDAIDEGAEYLLVVYTPTRDSSATSSFSFTLGDEIASPAVQQRLSAQADNGEEIEETEDFHLFLREMEAQMAEDSDFEDAEGPTVALRSAESDLAISEGSTRSFKVLNSLSSVSSCSTITAEAMLVTEKFVLYSDTSCPLNDSAIEGFEEFDDTFSELEEMTGGPSDVDGNGKFFILATCAVNKLGGSSGGFVTGFFSASDLYGEDDYACSNHAEMVYMNTPDPTTKYGSVAISESFWKNNLLSTVPCHEWQHMTSYNQHVFVNDSSSEDSKFNEHASHIIEDACYGFEISQENPSRAKRFLNEPHENDLYKGNSLEQRGGGYLVMRYLCEQADLGNLPGADSCSELLQNFISTGDRGIDNLENSTGLSFETIFGRFALTLGVSSRGLTDDNHYNFEDFNLYHHTFSDNRGTSFRGPATLSFSNAALSMSTNAVLLLSLTGEQITGMGNLLELDGSSGLAPRAHLIRLQ